MMAVLTVFRRQKEYTDKSEDIENTTGDKEWCDEAASLKKSLFKIQICVKKNILFASE